MIMMMMMNNNNNNNNNAVNRNKLWEAARSYSALQNSDGQAK